MEVIRMDDARLSAHMIQLRKMFQDLTTATLKDFVPVIASDQVLWESQDVIEYKVKDNVVGVCLEMCSGGPTINVYIFDEFALATGSWSEDSIEAVLNLSRDDRMAIISYYSSDY